MVGREPLKRLGEGDISSFSVFSLLNHAMSTSNESRALTIVSPSHPTAGLKATGPSAPSWNLQTVSYCVRFLSRIIWLLCVSVHLSLVDLLWAEACCGFVALKPPLLVSRLRV